MRHAVLHVTADRLSYVTIWLINQVHPTSLIIAWHALLFPVLQASSLIYALEPPGRKGPIVLWARYVFIVEEGGGS